ncbi:FimV N-terminal domain-containing protein [Mariprofundus aestuarium]|uniref:FimV N-terminal domain-containing protein n=1 Tax=Mariprofundus aestuarium TaxID=1921086 RepID=A0A2K8KZT0_MARES|nr:FimV/HubP family polar landmark protein [Mariprofundus aestuarium]ATX79439.1 FimV N-terminal domain-containing protein [Mariprofundus aestuarium]
MNRARHVFRLVWVAVALLLAGGAYAASLERIEVNSRLGEIFYAEIPLNLEADELVSKVYVEIASASDYKIFEVYRDSVLQGIRASVASDDRGTRVELTSSSEIKSPFFNLIVKVRHGRVAHFKKYPVFLELPKAVIHAAEMSKSSTAQQASPQDVASTGQAVAAEDQPASRVEYFDGWARTSRYGPIVRGDMLSTVVNRLSIDKRYTLSQVAVALFEKNRSKFNKDNINLMLKGSYLDVPTAAEVERLSASEAYKVFEKHNQQWKALKQKPRYAAEAEAQRTRYSKRVHIGKTAGGVASAPAVAVDAATGQAKSEAATVSAQDGAESGTLTEEAVVAVDHAAVQQAAAGKESALLTELQENNEILKQKLEQSEKRVELLSQSVDEGVAAASNAKVARLELLVARMQKDLESARAQAAPSQAGAMDWIVWVLVGLVIILLIVVVLLMRREPAHPAESQVAPGVAENPAALAQEAAPVMDVAMQESGEGKTDEAVETFNLSEGLSDTDTAEMVPFDSSAMESESNIDYLSEVDVYIRYGMEEEAMQQLEMALAAHPDNVEAHIRKAKLLHGKGDSAGFDMANSAALALLSGAALEKFNAAVSECSETGKSAAVDEVAEVDLEENNDVAPSAAAEEAEEEEGPMLDYDLSGIDELEEELSETDDAVTEENLHASSMDDLSEVDWLRGASFEDEIVAADEDEAVILNVDDEEAATIESILDEFEDEGSNEISLEGESIDTEHTAEQLPESDGTIDLAEVGGTQELDNLFNAFSEETEAAPEELLVEEPVAPSDQDALDLETELTATQHLDNLLGEFDDEDDFLFEVEKEAVSSFEGDSDLDSPGQVPTDEDIFGSTQHLGSLMSEFAGNEENGDLLEFDDESVFADASLSEGSTVEEVAGGHDATQEFDELLGKLSAESGLEEGNGEAEVSREDENSLSATQELDDLLIDFADDDDEEKDKNA